MKYLSTLILVTFLGTAQAATCSGVLVVKRAKQVGSTTSAISVSWKLTGADHDLTLDVGTEKMKVSKLKSGMASFVSKDEHYEISLTEMPDEDGKNEFLLVNAKERNSAMMVVANVTGVLTCN